MGSEPGNQTPSEEELESQFQFKMLKYGFDEGRRTNAIRAFLRAHDEKKPIPDWVQEFLVEAFTKYLNSLHHGTPKDLNKLIGPVGAVPGAESEKEKDEIKERDQWLKINICERQQWENLETGKKYTFNEACKDVAEIMKREKLFPSLKPMKWTAIKEHWKINKWSAWCKKHVEDAEEQEDT